MRSCIFKQFTEYSQIVATSELVTQLAKCCSSPSRHQRSFWSKQLMSKCLKTATS